MKKLATIILASILSVPAMAGNYLPYSGFDTMEFKEATYGTTTSLSVTNTYGPEWKEITNFAGMGSVWTHSPSASTTYKVFTPNGGSEVLFDENDAVGTSRNVHITQCNSGRVTVAEKGGSLTTAAGSFSDVIRLEFGPTPGCADAGTTSMWLAPGAGIVAFEENSFSGARYWESTSGSIGSTTYPLAFGLEVSGSFSTTEAWIDMMPGIGFPNDRATSVRTMIRITNHGRTSETFRFNNGQRYDISLIDDQGSVVTTWSQGRPFNQALASLVLSPGESLQWSDYLELLDANGTAVPAGNYTLRMEVVSNNVAHPAAESPLMVGWAL